ncbi:MAG: galactokinase family protein [bacterium]
MEDIVRVSAPGRLCLFGEHQDYLNLPVIACAISLRVSISGRKRNDRTVNLDLPDLEEKRSFKISNDGVETVAEDYFSSALNLLLQRGFTFASGFDCQVTGKIPISAGTASSSALVVAWINFLSHMSDQGTELSRVEIAWYAYGAEVLPFSGHGGMMDQYSSALGGTIFLDCAPETGVEPLDTQLKAFVLGDSRQSKDTQSVLKRVKKRVREVLEILEERRPGFLLREASVDSIQPLAGDLSPAQFDLLQGTVRNHEITIEAKECLTDSAPDHKRIGGLLNEQQGILRDVLGISTPRIDKMIEAALGAGAYGAKINGSGGGGCMFAYAGENQGAVAEAIEKAGGTAYIVTVDEGTRLEIGS